MAATRLLVIGGTAFVGRAVIEEASARGFRVTLFNRGQTNPELFPQVEKRHGNRDGGLDALGDGEWDLVVDTCGYLPHVVGQSVSLLANQRRLVQFHFITGGVCRFFRSRFAREKSARATARSAQSGISGQLRPPQSAL